MSYWGVSEVNYTGYQTYFKGSTIQCVVLACKQTNRIEKSKNRSTLEENLKYAELNQQRRDDLG